MADLLGIERRKKGQENKTFEDLKKGVIPDLPWDDRYEFGLPVKLLQLYGKMPHKEKGKLTNEYSKRYDKSKYNFLLDAPFDISADCCNVMKKTPMHSYSKETGRKPMTAQMASESRLRTQKWLINGCNAFESKEPISNPMSFWTEQDVLLYIQQNNLPICSVYGEVVENLEGSEDVEGQLTMSDVPGWEDQGIFDAERPLLKTTGCNRTGCMFCGFGCHLEKGESRFERMKKTHPKQYDYIMRKWEDGGLNYKEVIDWINEHGNLNIRY